MTWWQWTLAVVAALLAVVALYDVVQRKHTILRNFPLIGHLRFVLEAVGPELRQYIVTDNDSDKPFSRDQRRWVYTSAKKVNTSYGFGTDNDLEGSSHYLIIKQASFPREEPLQGDPFFDANCALPMAKVLGGARGRRDAFRPASAVNISSMSFGSLGGRAVEALNRGAALAGCWQGTGEGGLTDHHRKGGDLVWQIGTGYFGCRDAKGGFDLDRFRAVVESAPAIRAIEVKLSQGAKPGLGGMLPGVKVTHEIAAIRGVTAGVDCISPAAHSAFHDADSLLDFVELLAEVGITDRVVFIGAGKLGLPGQALLAFALGCDGVNVGREAMLAIGCIQAQRCHTDRCPTGVTTHSRWRQRGLDPADKSVRCANYLVQLRRELLRLSRACGHPHPALVTSEQLEILDDRFGARVVRDVFGYQPGWGRPSDADSDAIAAMMP